jgi:3-methylcrotonyl-CoA carboxylase alpha subunit
MDNTMKNQTSIEKILIANRGEIAVRVIKTCKRLGIKTVAIYSDVDSKALHVVTADEAYCIGGASAKESYLCIDKIVDVAKKAKVSAIHPGYGFLSENADFAKACHDNSIIFIGPSEKALTTMGSKQLSKVLLENHQVPLVPGYHGKKQDSDTLLKQARDIGFPVLLKAASGGGGKGMRIVEHDAEFIESLNSAKREAQSSFGDDTIIIEKLIQKPRHVEIQVFADSFGNTLYLFERDCSIQRRHQKIIEEAPAPGISQELREKMGMAAVNVAKAIDYLGAGTVEFLLDASGEFYFMEMNTRLQVEHPVTEMITDLDLVEWQISVAGGNQLAKTQNELSINGHAIEARIYAEDPKNNFLPSIGKITYLSVPNQQSWLRIDTGVGQGDEISMHYDPMIAKLIVWGEDRITACLRMSQALQEFHLCGLKTNINFLSQIISHDAFKNQELSTDFLSVNSLASDEDNQQIALLIAASYDFMRQYENTDDLLLKDTYCWQSILSNKVIFNYTLNEQLKTVSCRKEDGLKLTLSIDDEDFEINAEIDGNMLYLSLNQQRLASKVIEHQDQLDIFHAQAHYQVTRHRRAHSYQQAESAQGQLTAPMPGTVVAILKDQGEHVGVGDSLMVIEAMKMEHTICAPISGDIKSVYYKVGDQVNEGDELVAIEAT